MGFESAAASHSAAIPRLLAVFFLWKLVLLILAAASPGPGYDTSTDLLLSALPVDATLPSVASARVLSRLVRWDALHIVSTVQRGYLYEQDWAWGWGYTRLLHHAAKGAW